MKNSIYFGAFLVFLGACSYGVLATIVKIAYQNGYTTPEVTLSQFSIGWIVLLGIVMLQKKKKEESKKGTKKQKAKLLLFGTSIGLTSIFYYLCVKNLEVSIAIVLLMQSTWMGVILEWITTKKTPSKQKLIAAATVLIGTALAANLFSSNFIFDLNGFIFGLIAACSYTVTVYASGNISLNMPAIPRSFWMLSGGFIIVIGFALLHQITSFNYEILYTYGLLLALFGTILPPILFAYGMPTTGVGIGTIIGAVELPISVLMAAILLKEEVVLSQWLGVIIILVAVGLMNWRKAKN